ncbi:MAG: GerMN domain-containing protein [Candidatus Eisenbacteria bacterium]
MRKIIFVCVVIALVAVVIWLVRGELKKPLGGGEAAKPENLKTVTLYFASKDAASLVPEYRDVKASDTVLDDLRRTVETLISGPTGDMVGLFPPGVTVRGVFIDDKTAYIDFSRQLTDDFSGGSAGEYLLVASIVQTVCANFPEISAVGILVNGEEVDTIGGHMDISRPLHPKDWR